MPKSSRLYIYLSIFLATLILMTIVYLVGLARGRGNVQDAVATAQARSLLSQIVATDTPSPTPTHTETPTITPTPSATPTPTASPTPSPTPASPEEWAQRFLTQGVDGLNAIAGFEFTSERAEALLRSVAQDQFLIFAPVSYRLLANAPWSALVVPRTPDGKALPIVFWQEPNDQNRVRGQLLLDLFSPVDGRTYTALRQGVQHGVMTADPQGRFHTLLVERAGDNPLLPAWLLAQPSPASDFSLIWSSQNEPLWSAESAASVVSLDPREGSFLPDVVVDSPLPPGSPLRELVRAPGSFVEQAPFARQWANSRWTPATLGDLQTGGAITGYRMQGAGLRSSPLTSMAQLVALMQQGRVDAALTYATRLDLIQQAFDLGLAQPGWWMGLYLDDAGQEIRRDVIRPRLRFFDNGDRNRTFDASFELDASGFYKLASIQQAAAVDIDLVTPSAPLPTFTPTTETTGTTTPTRIGNLTPTPSATPLPAGAPTSTPESAQSATPWPTLESQDAATPLPGAVATATPAPPDAPTATDTPTPTITETPTAMPLPIPDFPADVPAFLTGVTNVTEPARLRGGPGRDFPVLAPIDNALRVGLFGRTDDFQWYLIRVEEPGHPNFGLLGWMFRDLVYTEGDSAILPAYALDGTPLTPMPPTATTAPGLPTETPSPEPSATSTPLQTPQVLLPEVAPIARSSIPPPEPGETTLTLGGAEVPANPLASIPATAPDGSELFLRPDSAAVEIWGGLFGAPDAGWVAAAGELLWPGAIVYVSGDEIAPGQEYDAARVRIVGAPELPRVALDDGSALREAVTAARASALVGGASAEGVSLLDTDGNVSTLWPDGASAYWLGGEPEAGLIAPSPHTLYGTDGFVWVRDDGAGLRIDAQPFHRINGIAGDLYTGLWWIEVPEAPIDAWQLWQWDPSSRSIQQRLQSDGSVFAAASPVVAKSLIPRLLVASPAITGSSSSMVLLADSVDASTQRIDQGIFRLSVDVPAEGAGALAESPRLVLAPGSYRSPIALSPDHKRLAYSVFDADQPSLTSGQITPANRIKMLTLSGPEASTIRTVYQTETALEFIAPLLVWQDNETLLTARSRFAAAGALALDLFGVVWIELPASGDTPSAISVRVPARQTLVDFTGCRDEESALLVLLNRDGSLEYARWSGFEPVAARFTVPNNLTRAFICWRVPTE